MPIIAIKDNPPTRYPSTPIGESGLNWYIAKVRARQEKALAFDLMSMQVGYYLPLFSKSLRRPDTGKARTSILPLFPSYLPFECEKVPDWLLRSDRVSTILEIKAQEGFKAQLSVIYRARENRTLAPSDRDDFELGTLVKIIDGPFKGLVGKLVKKVNGTILAIRVEGLGFAGIHVNPQNVVPVDPQNAASLSEPVLGSLSPS